MKTMQPVSGETAAAAAAKSQQPERNETAAAAGAAGKRK
jgi:hypothetical protein